MQCQQCDKTFLASRPSVRKYCDAACRAKAYRARKRSARTPSRGEETATTRSSMGQKSKVEDRRWDGRGPKRNVSQDVRCVRERSRVAFDEQVLSQAPAGAVGYRLVLPVGDAHESPRIVPEATGPGALAYWRLHPFELPDDLRLRNGRRYRLLWVDARGARLPPDASRYLPALRFFWGPPDTQQLAPNAEHPPPIRIGRQRRESRPVADAPSPSNPGAEVVEPEPGASTLDLTSPEIPASSAPMHEEDAPLRQDAASTVDSTTAASASAEPPGSERKTPKSAASVAPTTPEPVSPAVDAQTKQTEDVSASSTIEPTEQYAAIDLSPPNESTAVNPTPQRASFDETSIVPECSPPLSPQELRSLIRIVLHTEQCAALQHEIDCMHARVRAQTPPPSPEFHLREEVHAQIRSVVHDARLAPAAIKLYTAWLHYHAQGPAAMARLPAPFVSLTFADAERITSVLNNPPRRAYAEYVLARVMALHQGQPEPPQPTSDLPSKVRRHIRELFSDARLVVLMQHGIWTREGLQALRAEQAGGRAGDDQPAKAQGHAS